ncbi:MAG TPA: alpha/beta hydrolase-fold protein [Mycobacteriales bacterium]
MAHDGVHGVGTLPGSVTGVSGRAGWLEDWRVAAALLTLAAAVAAAWVVLAVLAHRGGRRPRHPLPRRLALAAFVALTALSGAGVAVNSYAGYAPDLATLVRTVPSLVGARDSGATAATVLSGGRYPARLFSVVLREPADRIPPGRAWIYLPSGYSDPANRHRRYPVAYLLHGYPSSSYDWFGAGQVARIASAMQAQGWLRPMILVSPDVSGGSVHDTECLDSTVGRPRIETFLTRTVVGTVDRDLRTLADRADRVLGGVSSGGFCTLNIGFRHQDEFGVLLALMPSGDPGRNAVRFMFHGDAVLGRLNSPSAYAPTMPLLARQYVFLAASLDDPDSVATAREMAGTLARRGVYAALRIDPAGLGHTWREARREAPYALAFASAHLGDPPARRPLPPIPPLDKAHL